MHCGPSTAVRRTGARDAAVTYAVSPVVPEAAPVALSALDCCRYLTSSKSGSVHVWLKCAAISEQPAVASIAATSVTFSTGTIR